jgi:hypothetical protein
MLPSTSLATKTGFWVNHWIVGELYGTHCSHTLVVLVTMILYDLCPLQASHPEVQGQVLAELQEAGLAAKDGKRQRAVT